MVRKTVIFLLVMLTLTFTCFASGTAEADDGPVTLEVWSRGEEIKDFIPGFEALHPDIKVNVTVIPDAEMTPKLITVLASGSGVPDLFMHEANYIKYLVEADCYADLLDEPYNAGELASGIWQPVIDVGTDSTGALRVLSWQASPGSIIYRRDIALEVLGTDDPDEITSMMDTQEEFMDVARKMKENGYIMVSTTKDLFDMMVAARENPWVVDGKLVIDDILLDFMDMAKEISDNGYDLGVDQWAAEWNAAVEGDDLFCYILPSWGYQFVVKPAAVKTMGKWGIAQPPVPYINGGSYLGIYKNTEHPEEAWLFLQYVCLNEEAQYEYAKATGDYVSLKAVDERLASENGEDVLAGQNPYQMYNAEMAQDFTYLSTIYDSSLNNYFLSAAKAYQNGMSRADAIEQFKNDVRQAYPEIVIE